MVMGHRETLEASHFEGQPHFFAACRHVGDPLAPVTHQVSGPYVKGGAIGGAGRAMVPIAWLVNLMGRERGVALPVHDARVASVAHGIVRVRRKVSLLLLLLLFLLFLFISVILLAAIILKQEGKNWG